MSRLNRPIGASQLWVTVDKESVSDLRIRVVSGLDVQIEPESGMSGTLAAHIITQSKLKRQFQVSVITRA
jgi:hypothetical protein